jgi:hypothetical protein
MEFRIMQQPSEETHSLRIQFHAGKRLFLFMRHKLDELQPFAGCIRLGCGVGGVMPDNIEKVDGTVPVNIKQTQPHGVKPPGFVRLASYDLKIRQHQQGLPAHNMKNADSARSSQGQGFGAGNQHSVHGKIAAPHLNAFPVHIHGCVHGKTHARPLSLIIPALSLLSHGFHTDDSFFASGFSSLQQTPFMKQ